MFTGIIEKTCCVVDWDSNEKNLVIAVELSDVQLGESIAINGTCLTVTQYTSENATFYVCPETMNCTNLGNLKKGSTVNVERALRVGDRMSGHWVQGHVDGLAQVVDIQPDEAAYGLTILLPEDLSMYCIPKGSLAVNGVSLTIQSIHKTSVVFQIVPHTWKCTNFSHLTPGDMVNVETDILTKYMEKRCQTYKEQLSV